MGIVGALDVHRRQVTFRTLDTEMGELRRGQIRPVTRQSVREWLERFSGMGAHFVLEATTGWRLVVEEIERVGCVAHLAETVETAAARGRKRRGKTDAADCNHMLKLLLEARLPEAWIAPWHIVELRTRVRLRQALADERHEWLQRLQAQLFHQGVPRGIALSTAAGRALVCEVELSPAGRAVICQGLEMVDYINAQLVPCSQSSGRMLAASRAPARCRRCLALVS